VRGLEEECGIIVWSLSPKEAWTQTTDRSIGNLMLAIFSWVAERERENLSERTKAGVARARDEGKHIGKPFREINWRKVDEYRAKGIIVVGRFKGYGHSLQHAACGEGTKGGKRELRF